jgi:hypothetical protein
MADAPSGVKTSINEALLQLWPALRGSGLVIEQAIVPELKRAITNVCLTCWLTFRLAD